MFRLRTARERALVAMLVLLLLLGSVTELAVWRARQGQEGHQSVEQASVAVASLQHAYDQFLEGQAMLGALVWAQDAVVFDMYRETAAEVEQTLSVARVEALAEGNAGHVAALDNLIERTGRLGEEMELAVPTVLEVDSDEAVQTATDAMPGLWAEVAAIRVDLGRLLQEGEDELAAQRDGADRAADITLWLLLGSGMAAFVAGSAVVVMLVRSVLRPLTSLRASVRTVTSGDLEARAEVSGPEEVASLARDFNEMVSERKRAEEALGRIEREKTTILNSLSELVAYQDTEMRIVWANKAAAESVGLTPEELVGRHCYEMWHQRSELCAQCPVVRSWETGQPQEGEVTTPDGRVWLVQGNPFQDANGDIAGVVEVTREITERKRAEEALRESETKYRRIFENVQDIFYQTDGQGIITEISPSVERWGYTREGLIGTQVLDVYENPEERSGLLEALLERGEVVDYEVHLKTGDGRVVDSSVNAHLFRGADGELVGVEGTLRDISERKRMEEALVQQAERERELHRKQSEFVSTASHELRTPLHSIRGFTRLLLDGKVPDPETQREFLTIIDEQSGQLTVLVRDLLDVARIEAGRMEVQREALAFADLVRQTTAQFGSEAEEKGITIEADLAPDLPVVEGDKGRLGQVLTNLVGNAIKFSEGAGTIRIGAMAEGPELVVSVQDEGIGIPSEALPRLFERFYQVNGSSTRQRRGTGLGLYISKQIVVAHGGRIWVESKVGEGSTFSFAIPVSVSGGEGMRTEKAA